MGVSKDEWRMGFSDENPPRGCGVGCLVIAAACLLLDALAAYAVWSFGRWLFAIVTAS